MNKKGMSRRSFVKSAAIAAAGVTFASRYAAAQAPLKVSYAKNAIHHACFVYLAANSEKFGFVIDLVNFDRYSDAMIALQKGQVQFGGLGYSNMPTLLERSMDNIKVISGNTTGGMDLVIRDGVEIDGWKSYEGLRIASPANSLATHLLRLNATEHDFDFDKVIQVNMLPGPAALMAMRQGQIDGLIAWEPWVAQAVVDGLGYVPDYRLADNSVGGINGIIGADMQFASANRETTVAFLKAMSEVYAYLSQNVDEHVKVAVEFMGIAPAVAREAIENFSYDERIHLEPARNYTKLLHEYGIMEQDVSPNLHAVVDYSFLSEATGQERSSLGGD